MINVNKINNQSINIVWKETIKPIFQVLGSQITIKACGFLLSILLVRNLTKEDYAIFTLLITVQGMLITVSSSSIFIGFNKIAGRIWNSSEKLSSLIYTTFSLSNLLIIISFFIMGIYSLIILKHQNVNYLDVISLLGCLFLIVIPEIKMSFVRTAILFRKEVKTVQMTELINQVLRLVLIGGVIILYKKNVHIYYVFLITILTTWFSYYFITIKKIDLIKANKTINFHYKRIILKYVKFNWHNSLFFAFKGQISILLIGLFGSQDNLAEIGALGRFAIIFSVFLTIFQNIYIPDFAKTHNIPIFKKKLANLFIAIFPLIFLILSFSLLFPEQILWLLGDNYKNLSFPLFLILLLGSIDMILGLIYGINTTKGWIKYTPRYEIVIDITTLIIGIIIFDISTLEGVIMVGICTSLSNIILHLFNFDKGIKS